MSSSDDKESSDSSIDAKIDSHDEKKDDSDDEVVVTKSEAIEFAIERKTSGNALFKQGSLDECLGAYKEATVKLSQVSAEDKKDSEIRELTVACNGNMAMASLKAENYRDTIKYASVALQFDHNNVKALYRRGCAYRKTKEFDEGKADLQRALSLDSSNAAAQKELTLITRSLKEKEKSEKVKYANIFGSGMYDDREEARIKKKKAEEEAENKLRDDWTKSKIDRRTKGLEEQTFEEYKKEIEEQKKKDAEEEKKKREEEEKARARVTKPSAKASKKKVESDSDSDEEGERIRGYKTTSDGRKTTFFNNEMDEKTKELIGSIAPQRLDVNANTNAPTPIAASSGTQQGSAWNSAGTFESKDVTKKARDLLKDYCLATPATSGAVEIKVSEVKSTEGDAEIVISRGKKKIIYDLEAEVEVSISGGDLKKAVKAKFAVKEILPDDSTVECSFSYNKLVPSEHLATVNTAMQAFRETLLLQVSAFKTSFEANN